MSESTDDFDFTVDHNRNINIYTSKGNAMFNQVIKTSSTNCCGSTCCGSETVIWEIEDPKGYATKVFADIDRENVSIYLLNGDILHFGTSEGGRWKPSSNRIALDLEETSSTIGYDFVHHGETRTFTAKPGYQFRRVFIGETETERHIFWKALTDDEWSNMVTVYGVETNVRNINIFLKNSEVKHFHKVNGRWVSETSIVLNIESNTDNDLFEYRSTRNYGHFNPKPNLTIEKIVKKDLEIWTAEPEDHGLKAVLMGSGKDEKFMSILLQSGNFVLLRKCGKGECWEDITQEKSDFSGIKMYSLEEGTSNYRELTNTDYDPIVFESRYGYEFKEGVKCVKITYNNKLLWSHTDDAEFGYLKGLYLDLPKDQFSVTNLKDQTKQLTKAKVPLDIEKTHSTDELNDKDAAIFYSPKDGYLFSRVSQGTKVIWESTGGLYGSLVITKTVDDVKYLTILMTNNMFKVFHLKDGNWTEITSQRHDITRLKFYGDNDTELKSSDYIVTIVDYSYQFKFNDGVNCLKIKLGDDEVWKPGDDPKFAEIKSFSLGLVSNNFYVINNNNESKKLEFKATPETATVITKVSVTKPKRTLVTLDIEKTYSTDEFDYTDQNGVVTFTPKDNHLFSKVSQGTTDIWESINNVCGTLVRTKVTKGVNYLVVLLTNNMFTLFHEDVGEWKNITSERHDITKIKFFGEGDTELKSSDYTVSIVDLSFTYIFNTDVSCKKVKLGDDEVWKHSDDDKFAEIKSFSLAAGTNAAEGTLRGLARELHDAAEGLNNAVTTVSDDNAAKVLKFKAGKDDTTDGKLRKLAKELYNAASTLETAAPAKGDTAKDDNDLKLKAGTTEDDGLRKLTKELHDKAQALAAKARSSDGQATDGGKARDLADAVGADEEAEAFRKKLKDLAKGADTALTSPAKAVRDAYQNPSGSTGVKQKFEAVKGQNESQKYAGHELEYQAVVTAWEAFNELYTADLKELATDLKNVIGTTSQSDKLQGALQALGNLPASASGPQLTGPAGNVKTAYQKGSNDGVKPKFEALQIKESSYKAIAAIKPKYQAVEAAMTAFDAVYKPEELLATAIGPADTQGTLDKPTTLREALYQLGTDTSGNLSDKAQAVKDKFAESFGPTVKSKFELVMAQTDAYKQGSTIKTQEYTQLLEAWTKFNDKYYGVISY